MTFDEMSNSTIMNLDASIPGVSTIVSLSGPFCLYLNFSGSPAGNLDLKCSLDGILYNTYSNQIISGTKSWIYNQPDSIWKYFKLIWTPTSGTGHITIQCRTFTFS